MTLLVSPQPTTSVYQPRDYQLAMVEEARARIRSGYKRILLQLPTGGGKTVVAAQIIHGALAKGKRVLFLAHRRELVEQPSEKLDALGVSHGIVMANHWRHRPLAPCQVASIQTLANRDLAFPPDLIFIDEAHRARANTYQTILLRYPAAIVIGLTATPVRSDGKGLGNLFETMVQGPSVADLTARGYLVPTRVFAPNKPDLRDVGKVGGDYNQRQLGRTMDKPTLTGDILSHWQRLGENRQTVGFAVSVEHSIHLRDKFREAGIAAEHLDGETPTDERAAILRRLANGETRVLWSVGVLTEGWDCPSVSCGILARPTMSEGLYLQMAGRFLRPAPGKVDALLLDHAGCTLEHGFVDDPRNWELTKDRMRASGPRIDTSLNAKACPICYSVVRKSVRKCLAVIDGKVCGYEFHFEDRTPKTIAGELQLTGEERRMRYMTIPDAGRKTCYLRWAAEGRERGYKANYASAKYFAVFRESPKTEWMLEASLEAQAKPGELRIAR